MKLPVYKTDGKKTRRKVELNARVFDITPNDHVLWLDVRRLQASRRQGTHKSKERSEIAGSMRKLYRQKGTGMARSGTVKSPLRRGGGRTFGPRPRRYRLKLNQKTRQLARCSALSYKAQQDAIRVVERIAFDTPNTQQLVDMVEALDLAGQKVLFLTETNNDALYRSSGNLAKVSVQEARNASTEALLGARVVVFEEGALALLTEVLGGAAEMAPADEPTADEAATDEADELATDEAPPDEAPAAEADEPATDEAPPDEAPAAEADEPTADEAATDEAPPVEEPAADADEPATDEAPPDEAAAAEAPPDEAAAAEAPPDEAPAAEADEPATDEAPPVEEPVADADEPATDEAPPDEAPAAEADEPTTDEAPEEPAADADEPATDEAASKEDKD